MKSRYGYVGFLIAVIALLPCLITPGGSLQAFHPMSLRRFFLLAVIPLIVLLGALLQLRCKVLYCRVRN